MNHIHELERQIVDDLLVGQVVTAILANIGKEDMEFVHGFPLSRAEKVMVLNRLRKSYGNFVNRVQIYPTQGEDGRAATLIKIKKKGK